MKSNEKHCNEKNDNNSSSADNNDDDEDDDCILDVCPRVRWCGDGGDCCCDCCRGGRSRCCMLNVFSSR